MSIAERGVRRRVVSALAARGYLVQGNPASASTGRGRSDLTVCAEGLFFSVEVKAPGEQPTPPQKRYALRVQRAGGVAMTVSSPQEALDTIARTVRAARKFV